MSLSHGPSIVKSGLVLCLDAANKKSYSGTDTTWADLSGNGRNGTLTNSPTYDAANSGSIVFDGVDDIVNVPYNTAPNLTSGVAFDVWVMVSAFALATPIFNCNTSAASTMLYLGQNELAYFAFRPHILLSNAILYYGSIIYTPVLNTWYNISFTYDTTAGFSAYINGISTPMQWKLNNVPPTGLNVSTYLSTDTISIGGDMRTNPSMLRFTGKISNFKFYNRSLSAAEVTQNFNANRGRFGI